MTNLSEAKRINDEIVNPIINKWKKSVHESGLNAAVLMDEITDSPEEHLNISLTLHDPEYDNSENGIIEVYNNGVLKFASSGLDPALRAVEPEQAQEHFSMMFDVLRKTLLERRVKTTASVS